MLLFGIAWPQGIKEGFLPLCLLIFLIQLQIATSEMLLSAFLASKGKKL